jgi:hypothetical protein
MEPFHCTSCGASVEVRKSSWDQTSVQWHHDAMVSCLERQRTSPAAGPNGRVFPGCDTLRREIREAAVRGEITLRGNTDA